MSVATIRTAAAAILAAVSGVYNVEEEQPNALDAADAERTRIHGDRVHYWTIRVEETQPEMGIGYVELRHRLRVEGFLGVARDNPGDGTASDETAATLLSAVVSAFAASTSRTITATALDSWDYIPEPITIVERTIGRETHRCHRMTMTFLTAEDA